MQHSAEAISEQIATLLRAKTEKTSENFTFKFDRYVSSPVSEDKLIEIASEITRFKCGEGVSVSTPKTFEALVKRHTNRPARALREGIHLDDVQQGLTYEIGPPTVSFLLHFLSDALQVDGARIFRTFGLFTGFRYPDGPKDQWDALETLRNIGSFTTIRIISDKPRPESYWRQHAEAVYFHLGYNLDVALMPVLSVDELKRSSAISRTRRLRAKEIDAPRRHYVSDLVFHYQLAVSAESPMLEYLSYYHVAEHWFENIVQDDLVEQVQNIITSPKFSYRRKRDIRDLIKKVNKAVQLRSEEVVINEQIALRLTLQKHVDLAQILQELRAFDPTLPEYYRNTAVPFSDGDKVDLNSDDQPTVYQALSRRIYKTRNALVHSKEGAKSRFTPFSDDVALTPELPLMRFVAEQIIVDTSTPQDG